MSISIKNARLSDDPSTAKNLLIDGSVIKEISSGDFRDASADEVIDAHGKLLVPGFYNTHCHAAMTALRGYADDLPLRRWLFEKIFPAEDKLNSEVVYGATMLAIAEMLACGTVSFSDMYFFMEDTARAVIESGIKANLCRGFTSSEDTDMKTDIRFAEAKKLVRDYNGACDGRIITDMCIHGEYTNADAPMRAVAEYAVENRLGMQIHISETSSENEECVKRRGMTPMAYFNSIGALDTRVCAAHCVYVNEEDMRIMSQKGVTAAHNPTSNLKLGSGIMPLPEMMKRGINISLGTDGAASNNKLDIIKEMQLAALLHKGVARDPTVTSAPEMIKAATENGAAAQGRQSCGKIEVGFRADLVLIDTDALNNLPTYDLRSALVYSAKSSDVVMTMVDGRVLYKNGEYKTIDIEKTRYTAKKTLKGFFE